MASDHLAIPLIGMFVRQAVLPSSALSCDDGLHNVLYALSHNYRLRFVAVLSFMSHNTYVSWIFKVMECICIHISVWGESPYTER